MNFRYTLALLVVAVLVLGGVAIAQKQMPAPKPAVTPTPVLFNLKSGDITGFDIKTKTRETDLVDTNSKWKLVKPSEDENVDQVKISSLASQVATLNGTRTVAGAGGDLSSFGLDQPPLTVTLTMKDGKAHTLLVGNRNVDGNYYYAMPKGGTEVSLIGSSVVNGLMAMADTPPRATPTPTPTNAPVPAATPSPTP
ncbi:MAG: DUF4340 domain-containing protein [Chloroflexota bacterium]|nr:DUF4340 domain-containing protein [Chloroflexota bacterium]